MEKFSFNVIYFKDVEIAPDIAVQQILFRDAFVVSAYKRHVGAH